MWLNHIPRTSVHALGIRGRFVDDDVIE